VSDPIKRIELKDGTVRYRFVIDIGRDPETGKRQQRTFTFDTKKEAKAEHARIKHECDRGTYVRPSNLTVNEFLDEYEASAARSVEEATASNTRKALLHVRDRLGTRRLQTVVESDVERLVDWMLAEGRRTGGERGTPLGARSAQLTLARFRAALNDAVRRQLVVRNVAHYVRVPRAAMKTAAAKRAERTPWTAEEVKVFLAGITGERLYALLLLSLLGLRPAEVVGLRWVDVDLDTGRIAAGRNTRTMVDHRVVEKGAKTTSGDRGLPAPLPVLTALKSFYKLQLTERLAAGEYYTASGYVAVDELGSPLTTDGLRYRAYKLMEKVGVRKVRLYDARHACLTYLAGAGVPDVVLAAWAGHSDGGTLAKRVYVHPDETHLQIASDRLGELLG